MARTLNCTHNHHGTIVHPSSPHCRRPKGRLHPLHYLHQPNFPFNPATDILNPKRLYPHRKMPSTNPRKPKHREWTSNSFTVCTFWVKFEHHKPLFNRRAPPTLLRNLSTMEIQSGAFSHPLQTVCTPLWPLSLKINKLTHTFYAKTHTRALLFEVILQIFLLLGRRTFKNQVQLIS